MWPFKRKIRQRRLEVRKNIQTATGPGWWVRFRTSVGVVPLLLAWVFFIGALLLDAWPLDPMTYRVGQFVPDNVYARVAFDFRPSEMVRQDRENARRSAPAVFRLNEALLGEVMDVLLAAPGQAEATEASAADEDALIAGLITPERAEVWKALTAPDQRAKYEQDIEDVRLGLMDLIVVSPLARNSELDRQGVRGFELHIEGREPIRSVEQLIGLDKAEFLAKRLAEVTDHLDGAIRPDVLRFLTAQLTAQPLYVKDVEASQAEVDAALGAVDARPPRRYGEGALLVPRTLSQPEEDRRGLTREEHELLVAENAQYAQTQRLNRRWQLVFRGLSRAAVLMGLTLVMGIYVHRYRPRVIINRWRTLAMVGLFLAMLAASKTMVFGLDWNPCSTVLPLLTVTIILIIAYDQRFAMVMGFFLAILIVLQLRASMATFVMLATAVTASSLMLHEIRSRSRLLEVTAMVAGLVFLVAFALGIAGGVPLGFVRFDAFWAAGMALGVGLVMQAILPVIERVFRIVTSMTLLEWCDASKPLLKRLAMEAPGTYNHSLQLGTMCETAAEAIGARGLLARVGAYYHDIGKINKPRYFIENRADSGNLHDGLSPEMSMLVIAGHVKDGVEMAREYGLPNMLHEFIATHHGTTVVQYFYHAATEQRRNGDDPAPAESQFRYPGPKPYSKEAGILMLADASESSVRAMADPTPGRIETQVATMVNRRLMDGQLDECDLTLREVHTIEESLVKSLCAVYHSRIAYPKPADERQAAPSEETGPAEADAAAS